MNATVIVGIALGLAMDCFAVAIGASVALRGATPRQTFRLSFHFGLFQALMPVVGWLAGLSVVRTISFWDHWVAFGLLCFVGGKALWTALSGDGKEREAEDPTRGWSLVILSVATSIDALAVGLTLAMLHVSIWLPIAVIGVTTASLTVAGMYFGARLGTRFGKAMEIIGGLVLIGIGVKIVFDHLLGG